MGETKLTLLSSLILLFLAGCFKNESSEKPPVHLNPNMDTQEKYKPYKTSDFFPNNSAMRFPVPGIIALGDLKEDSAFYFGKDDSGKYVLSNPISHSASLIQRGQDRYEIFCTPCHGSTGDGMGLMINYVYPPATSVHSNRVKSMPDGQIFTVISEGNVLMPSYKHQIPVPDRWAIVEYIRNLQKTSETP